MTELDDIRHYEMFRGRIEHEDGLIVQRLAWLVGSQSFLFTAFAIVVNGLSAPNRGWSRGLEALLGILPLVGIVSSALIHVGILAALRAMLWLRRGFEARGKTESALGVPALMTPMPIRIWGLVAPTVLPLIFIAAWTWLLVRGSP